MSTTEPENQPKPEGVDDGRPDWLPDNFKDAEAFRKSYDEQRKEMDRLRTSADEERAQFAAALEQINAQPQFQPAAGVDPQIAGQLAAYENAVAQGDHTTALAIQLGLSQQLTQQTVNAALEERDKKLKPTLDTQAQADRTIAFELAQKRVSDQYGERWAEIQPEVQSWLQEHQSWLPAVNDPAQFEQVIREGAETVVNAKAAADMAAIEADRVAKLGAQTAAGSGQGRYPTVGDDKKQAWDEVRNADVGSYDQARSGGR